MPHRFHQLLHDIRGKLASIHLAATLIHDGKAGPVTVKQAEFSALIIEEAEDLHLALQEIHALVGPT
jgi:hypothetical protein